ncbi:MAG: hypothetical protein JWL84_5865 [Rhodospirillales bacterium]|nr:hypothetical protein [Rhodospirillales bacterium]
MGELIGVGLYTPAEAGRLLHVRAAKIVRWLHGHRIGNHHYEPLWAPQINIEDGRIYLGFRDLMEVRVADKFISYGVSPQRVRAAIQLSREIIGEDRPLSTDRFRTDGRDIFLRVVDMDEKGEQRERLLNLFRRQYEFDQIIEPLLKTVDFDEHGAPLQWWPSGRRGNILVDPTRSFGQPIDAVSSVPTAVLAAAGRQEGIAGAASAYAVPRASIKRAIEFETAMERQAA